MIRKIASLIVGGLFLGILFFANSNPTYAEQNNNCTSINIPVHLSPLDLNTYNIVGWICGKGNLSDKTVQILIHGLTYDHNYWGFPYQEPNYSYLQSAINAGYAVLNIDRIGSGLSDHPNDSKVDLISGAYTIHQIIDYLRSGKLGNIQFKKIVLVGHSAGSGIAILEASTYQDVDGIILSGYAHILNPAAAPLIATDFYPADLDPKFANNNYSVGYITTKPGTREQLFYDASNVDPNLINLDEQLKQTGTVEELAQLPLTLLPNVSESIHFPVLIGDGQFDQLLCGIGLSCDNSQALLTREQLFFNSDACLETFILPNSGHDINLHLNSSSWYNFANEWIARRVGININSLPTNPCD